MVVLVLDGDGQKPFRFQLEPLPLVILRFYANFLPTLYLFPGPGEAQTPLVEDDAALHADDFRVDEDPEVAWLALGGAVDDEDLPELADLRGRQADSGGGVHGLCHVVDELA